MAVLTVLAAPAWAQVEVRQQFDGKSSDRISIAIGGKPFTEMFYGPGTAKPYLHPLRSASGKVVTRRYPMEEVAGESRDHPHHRGLWFSHGDVNGLDFWGNEDSQQNGKKGSIRLSKIVAVKSGAKSGEVEALFAWLDPRGKEVLTEDRRMVFYADEKNRTIDFDIRLRAAGKVTFGDTKEGTFAIRLAEGLREPEGSMTNSAGARTEKECWGKRADWMDYAGRVDGEALGVAIFDHPGNPVHPSYWHARGYGLFAANPFGAHDFTNGAAASGAITIEGGESLRFRYRVTIHPGGTDADALAKAYADYGR
jgi:hypothetical protein